MDAKKYVKYTGHLQKSNKSAKLKPKPYYCLANLIVMVKLLSAELNFNI